MLHLKTLAHPAALLGGYLLAAFIAASALFVVSGTLSLRSLPTRTAIVIGWLVFLAALALLSLLPVAQAHLKPVVRESAIAGAVAVAAFAYGVIDTVMMIGLVREGVWATVFVATPMLGILFAFSVLRTEWRQLHASSTRVLIAAVTFALSTVVLAGAIGAILILE